MNRVHRCVHISLVRVMITIMVIILFADPFPSSNYYQPIIMGGDGGIEGNMRTSDRYVKDNL